MQRMPEYQAGLLSSGPSLEYSTLQHLSYWHAHPWLRLHYLLQAGQPPAGCEHGPAQHGGARRRARAIDAAAAKCRAVRGSRVAHAPANERIAVCGAQGGWGG